MTDALRLPPEVKDLRRDLGERFPTYPAGLSYAAPHNATTAFFPGGHGLWGIGDGGRIPWPRHEVMVVGNDFGRPVGSAGELRGPTWTPLVGTPGGVLTSAHIALRACFFTNAYMGIRLPDWPDQQGASPGLKDTQFVQRCRDFFFTQFERQQPRLVVGLGGYAHHFLAEQFGSSLWLSPNGDRRTPIALTNGKSAFFYAKERDAYVAALVHPANRRPNLVHRSHDGFSGANGWQGGHLAELRILENAIAYAGLEETVLVSSRGRPDK